jgi:hypothetical protein
MDIALAILPWKIIWSITIKKRERLGALVAMSAGVMSVEGTPVACCRDLG